MVFTEIILNVFYFGFRLHKLYVYFFKGFLHFGKLRHAFVDNFFLARHIVVSFANIFFKFFKLGGKRRRPFLDRCNFRVNSGNPRVNFFQPFARKRKFIADIF